MKRLNKKRKAQIAFANALVALNPYEARAIEAGVAIFSCKEPQGFLKAMKSLLGKAIFYRCNSYLLPEGINGVDVTWYHQDPHNKGSQLILSATIKKTKNVEGYFQLSSKTIMYFSAGINKKTTSTGDTFKTKTYPKIKTQKKITLFKCGAPPVEASQEEYVCYYPADDGVCFTPLLKQYKKDWILQGDKISLLTEKDKNQHIHAGPETLEKNDFFKVSPMPIAYRQLVNWGITMNYFDCKLPKKLGRLIQSYMEDAKKDCDKFIRKPMMLPAPVFSYLATETLKTMDQCSSNSSSNKVQDHLKSGQQTRYSATPIKGINFWDAIYYSLQNVPTRNTIIDFVLQRSKQNNLLLFQGNAKDGPTAAYFVATEHGFWSWGVVGVARDRSKGLEVELSYYSDADIRGSVILRSQMVSSPTLLEIKR